ncbi:hypothetical protein SIM91_00805 [Rhodococcus opacus]|nr:hypothetical protein [Rhodococcus opacus]MDX5961900.1 hypothetical protein [Rhodococcus opacus]
MIHCHNRYHMDAALDSTSGTVTRIPGGA